VHAINNLHAHTHKSRITFVKLITLISIVHHIKNYVY
jgi:hypothetical protein